MTTDPNAGPTIDSTAVPAVNRTDTPTVGSSVAPAADSTVGSATPAPRTEPHRLVVISVDAMSDVDVPFARTLPNFARIFEGAWARATAIYPSVTYPNHTAQVTGRTAAGHGIYANELVQPGVRRPDWFWDARAITCPTIFDLAKAAGLRTATVNWPVTGWAPSADFSVPEVVDRCGLEETRALVREAASAPAREYVDRHSEQIEWTKKPHFGRFATSVAADVIREQQPHALFIHLVDVDSERHATGRFTPEVKAALERVDGWIGEILAAIEEAGLASSTNVAIVSDHGHVEVGRCWRPNTLLVEEGLVRVDADGEVESWDAWVHACGLTGQLHLHPEASDDVRARVLELVQGWVADPEVPLEAFHPSADMRERYGYDGPFLGVLEGTSGTNFQNLWDGRSLYTRFDEDYTFLLSQHGHLPEQDIQAVFALQGPDAAQGVRIPRCTVPDEAVTFAHLLGLEIPEADGAVVRGMLTGDAARG